MGLNEGSKETTYVLGRLFSVLESIQMDANPAIKATIRDRYFNSACATPAYYEKLLTEIAGKIDEFPKRLSLEEQGKFILGYYHQVQKKYEKKEDK